jgi:iron complex outermembrane receptor protein
VLKNRDVVEEDAEQFSLEARLATPADSTLQWVAGLYYFTEEVSREESFLTQFSLLPIAGGDVTFFQDVDSMTYAVFGQATYPFTDRLSATLSLRYSHDDKEADQLAINNDPTDATPGIPLLPGQPYDIKADDSWDATTGRFALDYRKDAGQLLYASVSKGFKSGIFPSQNNVVQNVGEATPPEEVWSYEIGAKTEWFEETLRVNLAIFCMDYQDLQLFRLNPRLVLVTFTENTVNTGAELPRAPEFTFGGFAQYSWPLAGGNMALRADFKWTDDYRTEIAYTTSPSTATSPASDAANARITTIKSFALLDARLSYAPGERNLEFSPWGQNLTDETYPMHIIPFLGNGFSIFAPLDQ